MNLKIVFTIIGIILSMATSVWSQDICAQVIVCDQYGKQYSTPCTFADAQKNNPDLKETPCTQGNWNR